LKEDGKMDIKAIEDTRDKARRAYECGQMLSDVEDILIGNRDVWSVYLSWEGFSDQQNWLEEFLEV